MSLEEELEEEVPEDRDAGEPILLIVSYATAADNALRLLQRLQEEYGYGVTKEYDSDHQTVYSITPAFDTEENED